MLEKAPQASADTSPRQLIEPDPALLFKITRILDHVDKGANDKAKAALADAQVAPWLDGMRKNSAGALKLPIQRRAWLRSAGLHLYR